MLCPVTYAPKCRIADVGITNNVDTWTAYVKSSNDAVITACDFICMDAYPDFQNTMSNAIDNGNALFFNA